MRISPALGRGMLNSSMVRGLLVSQNTSPRMEPPELTWYAAAAAAADDDDLLITSLSPLLIWLLFLFNNQEDDNTEPFFFEEKSLLQPLRIIIVFRIQEMLIDQWKFR